MKILFVCSGNTCRSVIAEWFFRKILKDKGFDDTVEVSSRGTIGGVYLSVPEEVINIMIDEGIDDFKHISKPLDEDILKDSDLILVMEESHKKFIERNFSFAKEKTSLLKEYVNDKEGKEIYDPIGCSQEVYNKTANEIKTLVQKLWDKIKNEL